MAKKKSPNTVESVPLMLRMPPVLHASIKAMAEKDRRSLNTMVVLLLEAQIAMQLESTGVQRKGD